MTRALSFLFFLIFILTGGLVVAIDLHPNSAVSMALAPDKPLVFGVHMACWMVLGMLANYLWDLFKAKKTLADVNLPDLLLPLLVSPIVFYGIWSMWSGEQKISFAFNLISFQNGFFWQVILSKAGPVTSKPGS